MSVASYSEDVTITQKKATLAFTHRIAIPKGPVHRKIFSVDQWRYLLQVVLVKEDGINVDMLVRDVRIGKMK